MNDLFTVVQVLLLIPVIGGSVYAVLCLVAISRFARCQAAVPTEADNVWPPVSVLKPLHGLEKNLEANIRSTCTQAYPDYQVVLSVQRLHDPALPLIEKIQQEYGPERVSVVVADSAPVVNGKIQNLTHALSAARHDILVISDSDVLLRPDYLKTIVAPLRDPQVGYVCTLYRAIGAERWFERLELLTLNADFTVNLIFAHMTQAASFCLGASTALRRSTLQAIGGFASLAEYLVEDYEMGRRIQEQGLRGVVVPYFVDTVVDLQDVSAWWRHQVYWDQNTRAARPLGFFATVLTRSIPFALLYAVIRGFDVFGLFVLVGALTIRLGTTDRILRRLGDHEGVQSLALLPLRDLAGLGSWLCALCKKTFVWRGHTFELTRNGRIVPRKVPT